MYIRNDLKMEEKKGFKPIQRTYLFRIVIDVVISHNSILDLKCLSLKLPLPLVFI